MQQLFELLKQLQYTIASMESCTGGLFASELTSVAGVSQVFKGSLVAYTNVIKVEVGGIDKEIIERFGAVSLETALMMAKNAQQLFESDVAVSFTGNAGPHSLEGKAAGYVCSCIVVGSKSYTFEDEIMAERNTVRAAVVQLTVKRLKNILEEEKNND